MEVWELKLYFYVPICRRILKKKKKKKLREGRKQSAERSALYNNTIDVIIICDIPKKYV